MRVLILPVLVTWLAACVAPTQTVEDALRASGIRTVTVEDDFTLYTPYDAGQTAKLANMVQPNLRAVAGQLEWSFEQSVLVHARLEEVEGLQMKAAGDRHHMSGSARTPSLHGVVGYASSDGSGGKPMIAFLVAREPEVTSKRIGLTITIDYHYEGTIRHELAHQYSMRQGLEGEVWFDEGLAQEMEYATPDGDGLVPDPWPTSLERAAEIHRETPLSVILDWREDGAAIAAGKAEPYQDGRPLAHSFMRFLLEQRGGERSPAAFRTILEMSREQHLALEDDWHSWLDAGPPK